MATKIIGLSTADKMLIETAIGYFIGQPNYADSRTRLTADGVKKMFRIKNRLAQEVLGIQLTPKDLKRLEAKALVDFNNAAK